jgi:hypothetical protein
VISEIKKNIVKTVSFMVYGQESIKRWASRAPITGGKISLE